MLTDPHLAHLVRHDWLTDGPLHEFIDPYIDALTIRHYAPNTFGLLVAGFQIHSKLSFPL